MERLPHALLSLLVLGCSTDTFSTVDAGDGGAADVGNATIQCKGTPRACFTSVESCCLRTDQSNDECIKRPPDGIVDCPGAQGYVVACDDQTDCPKGTVCCATQQQSAFSSTCVPLAGCVGGGRGVLCDKATSPSQCDSTKDCTPLPTISRYFACQARDN